MAKMKRDKTRQDAPSSFNKVTLEQWPWLKGYRPALFQDDLIAASIVTVLLVPQSLAYALLAGLPPQIGLYASITPLIAYALFGSSRFLSVGPTAVISLMTAVAIAQLPAESQIVSAAILALMMGVILLILGLLRGGFIMNFVSRPVVSAYITGAAFLIIISQIKHILGVKINSGGGTSVIGMVRALIEAAPQTNMVTLIIGLLSMLYLWSARKYLAYIIFKIGLKARRARTAARLAPVVAIGFFIYLSYYIGLEANYNVNIVGHIPRGLPPLLFPPISFSLAELLFLPALIIALVAFVDSMSTAQTFAARARNRIDANKELLGMGASNFISGLFGGYPVNGSMSRTAVNYSAGAKTPMASMLTAGFMVLAVLFLTPVLQYLPLATLAALIIVACFSLFDFKTLWQTWIYSHTDGMIALVTFLSVLFLGVQWGVLVGVVMSMTLHIRTTLRPNMALVGRFLGTQHYRDADRFNVETNEYVKTLRIDESLYYANARYLEDKIARIAVQFPKMTDLILMCPAVNRIDASALSSLEMINERLKSAKVKLHFSELHSDVKERLERSEFFDQLTGHVFFTQHEAMENLEPEPDWAVFSDHIDIH